MLLTIIYGVLVVGGICLLALGGFELVLERFETSDLSDIK